MARVFVIIGKSGSGKDTFFKTILSKKKEFNAYDINLIGIIPYTSRPKRAEEHASEDIFYIPETECYTTPAYVFKDSAFFKEENHAKFIEHRVYAVANGEFWFYATPMFEPQGDNDYILIATPEALPKIQDVFTRQFDTPVITIMTTCDPRTRIGRMLDRIGKSPTAFQVKEQCRRFVSDEDDFSEEMLSKINRLIYIPSTLSKRQMVDLFLNVYNER
ncbi:MAG: hypothetical protein J6Y02_09960 [Pseudobutyrivibrio sp.]|nr:hypothetical protein [Pseudobutyrivibrio sp.]